jgi:formylglycine-generating enzyme required for sulfatase activity
MKKIVIFGLLAVLLVACSTRSGHLTGVQGRAPYHPEIPLGMVYIPSGSYNMGEDDEDVPFLHQTRTKTVSVQAFYMDQTEITNNEYRQFVYWVRDSIAREKIIAYEDYENVDADQLMDFMNWKDTYFNEDDNEIVETEIDEPVQYRNSSNPDLSIFTLNWDKKFRYDDPNFIPVLADMYYKPNERFYGRREIDSRKLRFKYVWIDWREAAKRGRVEIVRNGATLQGKQGVKEAPHRDLVPETNPFNGDQIGLDADYGFINKKGQNNAIRGHVDRSKFIINEEINVYPDTLCWVRDFTYSFHDPMSNMYFWHPAYDNYPLVGVTWVQARAFSVWRTQLLNGWLQEMGELFVNDFRLPTEAEWERAARGDLPLSPYPWGGPYIRNASGCFLGNFKPMRGRYFEDGGFHTVKAFSYNPNGFGLYCMAGNVAEWCETAYDESMYEFSHDLNTEYRYDAMDWDTDAMKRKVIRGGSWKDIGYYLQTSSRTFEYQDTAKSYVGFRNVMTHLGRGGKDFTKEGGEEIQSDIELK